MIPDERWRLSIRIRFPRAADAELLARALGPESAREVPRTRAVVDRPAPAEVRVEVEARDTGAARAAANTYLGWIDLTVATLEMARRADPV